MKVTASILTIILLLLGTTSCTNDIDTTECTDNETTTPHTTQIMVMGSWANSYEDINELSEEADVIAFGEIISIINVNSTVVAEARWGPVVNYSTDYKFKLNMVLKGNETEEITIHQIGAQDAWEVSDDPLFQLGEKYILFLRKSDVGTYFVMGGPQGRFKVVNDKVFSMNYIIPDHITLPSGLVCYEASIEDFSNTINKAIQ